jgi:hypothetical protein
MEPNYSSAVILNNLVKAYNLTSNTQKISKSILDYCVAGKNPNDILTLNYGLSKLSSNNIDFQTSLFVLGKGIYTSSLGSNYVEIPSSTEYESGFNFTDIYNSTDELQDCYLLGKLYLTSSESGFDFNFVLAKSSLLPEGENIILNRDVSLNDALDILNYSTDITFPLPSTNYTNNLLLYNFIISIDKYTNDINTDRYFIYLYDQRTPKGLFGLSDENLYTYMISKVILGNKEILELVDVELNNIKALIQSWVDLNSWDPDFVTYWQSSEKPLPDELTTFLDIELGIIV